MIHHKTYLQQHYITFTVNIFNLAKIFPWLDFSIKNLIQWNGMEWKGTEYFQLEEITAVIYSNS